MEISLSKRIKTSFSYAIPCESPMTAKVMSLFKGKDADLANLIKASYVHGIVSMQNKGGHRM